MGSYVILHTWIIQFYTYESSLVRYWQYKGDVVQRPASIVLSRNTFLFQRSSTKIPFILALDSLSIIISDKN